MAESKGDRLGEPEEEITDGLAVTDPYPKDGPPQLRLEVVTGEYPAGQEEELITKMREGVPSELMEVDGQTERLTSGDIIFLEGDSLPETAQQLADVIVSGSISEAVPTRMITEVTTELLSPEQVEIAMVGSELNEKVRDLFDRKIDGYLGELDNALRLILQDVRDKVCARFKDVHVENVDEIIEALSIQMGIVIEAVITREFGKLINLGYISVKKSE